MNIFHNNENEKREKERLAVINFSRAFFAGIIIFEILNFLKILEFNTQFTWLGLVITSIMMLGLLEVTAYKYKKKKIYKFLPFLNYNEIIRNSFDFQREKGKDQEKDAFRRESYI